MSTLLWSSPRSSPSPGERMPFPHHPSHHHHVAFGSNALAQSNHSSSFSNGSIPSTAGTGTANTGGSAFGFGFGGHNVVSPSTPAGFGFGSSSSATSASAHHHPYFSSPVASTSSHTPTQVNGYGQPITLSPFKPPSAGTPFGLTSPPATANRRRRRRSDSSTGDDGMQHDTPQEEKRIKREIRPSKSTGKAGAESQSQNQIAGAASASSEVDLGKALASLTKPALLSVLTSLLSAQPNLKPAILALLPSPSLESFTTTLAQLERKVLDALPVGTGLRDEYIWSRVRAPLEEYIAEVRLALGQFCTTANTASTGSNSQHQNDDGTLFTFLATLTLSIRKLEILLPRAPLPFGSSNPTSTSATPSLTNPSTLNPRDPLLAFLPALFNQWHLLATRLSALVNTGGRILSAEMVRTWFRQLDSMVDLNPTVGMSSHQQQQQQQQPSPAQLQASGVGRRASEAVRERFVKELGWLIGIRPSTSTPAVAENIASNAHDAQMSMMADGDNSDEEL